MVAMETALISNKSKIFILYFLGTHTGSAKETMKIQILWKQSFVKCPENVSYNNNVSILVVVIMYVTYDLSDNQASAVYQNYTPLCRQ